MFYLLALDTYSTSGFLYSTSLPTKYKLYRTEERSTDILYSQPCYVLLYWN